jgi:hypothetical protein
VFGLLLILEPEKHWQQAASGTQRLLKWFRNPKRHQGLRIRLADASGYEIMGLSWISFLRVIESTSIAQVAQSESTMIVSTPT